MAAGGAGLTDRPGCPSAWSPLRRAPRPRPGPAGGLGRATRAAAGTGERRVQDGQCRGLDGEVRDERVARVTAGAQQHLTEPPHRANRRARARPPTTPLPPAPPSPPPPRPLIDPAAMATTSAPSTPSTSPPTPWRPPPGSSSGTPPGPAITQVAALPVHQGSRYLGGGPIPQAMAIARNGRPVTVRVCSGWQGTPATHHRNRRQGELHTHPRPSDGVLVAAAAAMIVLAPRRIGGRHHHPGPLRGRRRPPGDPHKFDALGHDAAILLRRQLPPRHHVDRRPLPSF